MVDVGARKGVRLRKNKIVVDYRNYIIIIYFICLFNYLMNCYLAGTIGLGLLGATFYTMTAQPVVAVEYRNKLKHTSLDIYDKIVKERSAIYFQGLILGLVVSYIVLFRISPMKQVTNMFHRITMSLAIVVLVSSGYYCISPKSDYMLNHVTSGEESKAWLEMYKTMKHRYVMGFILGSCVAIPLVYSFC